MAELVLRDVWRLPGLVSLSRVPLAFLFVASRSRPLLAIAILFLAALTDVADGWLARRLHLESPAGRVLDPIADKFFVAVVIISLVFSRALSIGDALLLSTRELCQAPLMMLLVVRKQRAQQRPIRGANRLGKAATVLQFASVTAILLGSPHRAWWIASAGLCGLMAGLSYAVREWRALDRPSNSRRGEPAGESAKSGTVVAESSGD